MTLKGSVEKIERYLLGCRSFSIRRISVLSGFSFSLLVYIHAYDWTEDKNDCKPISAALESHDAKDTNCWLSLITMKES